MSLVKVGLELHQQLATNKLFCRCPSELKEEIKGEFSRYLRPTQSELGEIDSAAAEAAKKHLRFIYQTTEADCLVEADEEPPHAANSEAIEIALQIAAMLNATPVNELQFMRKIVIDGSNTTGFQRTALVAINGYIELNEKRIEIPTICLEEDAARKIAQKEDRIIYRLDRQGIPLIEIATAPQIETPEEARDIALYIGSLLRATKKVKRGIGTIREDLNISIFGGARIELKGVQELNMIAKYIEEELRRQQMLISLAAELNARNARVEKEIVNLSSLFSDTKCKIIQNALKTGGKVLGVKLTGFCGTLKDRLGPELAARARVKAGVGLIHSDELPGYGISEQEMKRLYERFSLGEKDAFVLVAASVPKVFDAIDAVLERAEQALKGVPEETRDPLPDGTSVYSRPLPGSARMYPETDVPPVVITREHFAEIAGNLPELPNQKIVRFVSEYGLSVEEARQLVASGLDEKFEYHAKMFNPRYVARTFLAAPAEMIESQKKTVQKISPSELELLSDISKVDDKVLHAVFSLVKNELASSSAIPGILKEVLIHRIVPEEINAALVEKLGFSKIGHETIKNIVAEVLQVNSDLIRRRGLEAEKALMGEAMKRLRGRAEGMEVSKILRTMLENFIIQYRDGASP